MSIYNPFSLKEKTIFVTGASSGIGKAIAIECSKMGAKLVISGRNTERLNETFCQLEGEGHLQLIADLNETDAITNIIEQLPKLDGVVHCAGIAMPLPFQFVNEKKINEIFSVNFISPTLLTQKIIKNKLLSKNSSIVFISSISGTFCSYIGGSLYSATKGAVNGLIKGLALDLSNKNIRVNSIAPGMIETSILSSGEVANEQLEEDKKRYPLGKRYGKPEEVAYAVIYLLSDASAWVTGSNLLIDGGYTLQ